MTYIVVFVIIFLATSPSAIGKWLGTIRYRMDKRYKEQFQRPMHRLDDDDWTGKGTDQ